MKEIKHKAQTILMLLALIAFVNPSACIFGNTSEEEHHPRPTAPEAPTDLDASLGSIVLNWQDNSNNEDGFAIERRVGSDGFVEIDRVGQNIETYTDDYLFYENIPVTYRVRAYSKGTYSKYSNETTISSSFWCGSSDIFVSGNLAYSVNSNALFIFDITDKSNPIKLGSLFLGMEGTASASYRIGHIQVFGDYVFVAYGEKGVRIIDVSDKSLPKLFSTIQTEGYANNLFLEGGDYLHVSEGWVHADGFSGMEIFDVRDISVPTRMSIFSIDWNPQGLYVKYPYAVLASDKIYIISVEDRSSPFLAGQYESVSDYYYPWDVFADTNYIYASGSTQVYDPVWDEYWTLGDFRVIDYSTPSNPVMISSTHPGSDGTWTGVNDGRLSVSGGIAVLNDGYLISIQDISNPSSLNEIYTDFFKGANTAIDSDYLFVAGFSTFDFGRENLGFFGIYDLIDPANPALISRMASTIPSGRLARSGNTLYIASDYLGFSVIDIGTPYKPVLIDSDSIYANDFVVSNRFLYAAKYNPHMINIFDISDPESPVLASTYYLADQVDSIDVKDGVLIASATESVEIVDVSDPYFPQFASFYNSEWTFCAFIDGSRAFLGQMGGFEIIDISDIQNPHRLNSYYDVYYPFIRDLFFDGHYLYGSGDGLVLFEIGQDSSIKWVDEIAGPDSFYGTFDLVKSGELIFVAAGEGGVMEIKLSKENGIHLELVRIFNTPGFSEGLEEKDGYIIIGDVSSLLVYGPFKDFIDNDGDNMPDFWEADYKCLDGEIPDQDLDADADGLNNYMELIFTSNPCDQDTDNDGLVDGVEVFIYATDPTLEDTDGDGLSDKSEIITYGTDPSLYDSDFDSLDDKTEIDLGTNPNEPDTDFGGETDGDETFSGSDPLNPSDDSPPFEIGNGLGTWLYPLNSWWHDARTQTIYLASELGQPGAIIYLALDVSSIPKQTLNNFTIRMKHTTLSEYSAPAWEDMGWTVVYQNNEPPGETGWHYFVFPVPFNYNGIENLMVDISFNNSDYTLPGYCRHSVPGGNRSVYYATDSEWGDPLLWSGSSNPVPYMTTKVPNIKLIFK